MSTRKEAGSPWIPTERLPAAIGRFKGLRPLPGRGGGQAVVLEGRAERTGQRVVVKLYDYAGLDQDEARRRRERFRREESALSEVDHGNKIGLLDSGQTPLGQDYLVMPFFDGMPLDEYVAGVWRNRAGDPSGAVRHVLELFERLCDVVAAVHARSIVHRDLKPANVLVNPRGDLRLLDFGLAVERADTRVTEIGHVVGTATYMSPEQAEGEELDPRSDVFALGLLLYEMLTGQTPYAAAGHDGPVRPEHVANFPVPPPPGRQLGLRLGADGAKYIDPALDRLVLQAISADPAARRWFDARGLHAALQHYLKAPRDAAPAPPTAPARRPDTVAGTTRPRSRSAYRRAGLLTAVAAPLVVAVAVWRGGAAPNRSGAGDSRSGAPAVAALDRIITAPIQVDRTRPLNDDALVAAPAGLDAPDAGAWTVEPFGHRQDVTSVAYDPTGRWLASAGFDGTVRIWACRPDGAPQVPADANADAGEPRPERILVARARVDSVAWSRDGQYLAVVGSGPAPLTIWTPGDGRCVWSLSLDPNMLTEAERQAGPLVSVAWSPTDGRLAVGCEDEPKLHLWEVKGGKVTHVFSSPRGPGAHGGGRLAWSADGLRIAQVPSAGNVEVWDAAKLAVAATVAGPPAPAAVAWSPDRRYFAIAGTAADDHGVVQLFDAQTYRPVGRPLGLDQAELRHVAWSPDSRKLLIAGGRDDRRPSVWDVSTTEARPLACPAREEPWSVAWHPGGAGVAFGARSGAVGIGWPDAVGGQGVVSRGGASFLAAAFDAPSGRLAVARPDGVVWVWDGAAAAGAAPRAAAALPGPPVYAQRLEWSPDGSRLAATGFSKDAMTCAWEFAPPLAAAPGAGAAAAAAAALAPRLLLEVPATGNVEAGCVAWAPDGRTVAVATSDNRVLAFGPPGPGAPPRLRQAWAVPVRDAKAGWGIIQALAIAPSGDQVAVGLSDGAVEIVPVRGGGGAARPLRRAGGAACETIAWSADGARVVAGGGDARAGLSVFDARTGAEVARTAAITSSPLSARFADAAGNAVRVTSQSAVFDAAAAGQAAREWPVTRYGGLWLNMGATFARPRLSTDGRWVTATDPGPYSHQHVLTLAEADSLVSGAPAANRVRVVPTHDAGLLVVGNDGHWRSPQAAADLLYVVETPTGQLTLTPAEFARRFGRPNAPASAGLRGPPAPPPAAGH